MGAATHVGKGSLKKWEQKIFKGKLRILRKDEEKARRFFFFFRKMMEL